MGCHVAVNEGDTGAQKLRWLAMTAMVARHGEVEEGVEWGEQGTVDMMMRLVSTGDDHSGGGKEDGGGAEQYDLR